MSTAAAAVAAPAPKGKKKLMIILGGVVLLVIAAATAAALLLSRSSDDDEEDDEDKPRVEQSADAAPKRAAGTPPAYVPLDMFVVNLADRETERYAQVGVTLEMVDAKQAEMTKTFMPAIRNNILMVLAHKTSAELLAREGKQQLATELQRAASRALGVEVTEPKPAVAAADEAEGKGKKKGKKAKKPAPPPPPQLPVLAIHFSSFIVQ